MEELNFKYQIDTNENGRYVIGVSDDCNPEIIEHKFMALELTRTIMSNLIKVSESSHKQKDIKEMKDVLASVIDVADFIEKTMKQRNGIMDEVNDILKISPDVTVQTIEDLENLSYTKFVYNNKFYNREIGLSVKVLDENETYVLVGGIDNKHWTKLKK